MKTYIRVLTIAGSDSGGGAGIQADLKTFSSLGVYGMSALTAITAQNTYSVRAIEAVSPAVVRAQIEAVLDDIGVDAVKTGMLHGAETVRVVAETLKRYGVRHLVVDPVMISKSGDALLRSEALQALQSELLPIAEIITPNWPEAEALLGNGYHITSPEAAARELLRFGSQAVLLKGGHSNDANVCRDWFANADETVAFESPRLHTRNTHGTGCRLSAALAAYLALGLNLRASVASAKDYLSRALARGSEFQLGQGNGPLCEFGLCTSQTPD